MSPTGTPPEVDDDLDRAIDELGAGAERWAGLPLDGRARLLREVHAAIAPHASEWVRLAAAVKGLPAGSPLVGEEWLSGPHAALFAADASARSLEALARGGSTLEGARLGRAPGGRVAVTVLPEGLQQAVQFNGFSVQVWLEPGVTAEQARREAGLDAVKVGADGGVCVVLGAGNITSIAPLDALYELVAHNRASIVKLNPTFASLRPVYEAAFAPLVRAGLLRVVNGGPEVGAHLTGHAGIAKVHITGSARTHDAIVWGTGEEAVRRRAAGEPRLTVPITSELGGVSPVIVVPGRWSAADLRYQAEHVAMMRLHNAGHNCVAGQVLVLSADWPQRDAFLAELHAAFDRLPARGTWYPGTEAKVGQAVADHPGAELVNGRYLVEIGPGDPACTDEYFAPVLAWTQVPGIGAGFLDAAVAFANDELAGTLGANVLVAPRDRRALGARFDDAIVALRYGTVAINAWTGVGYSIVNAPWGAFPGDTLDDIGSGIGVVHNGHLLAHTERTVVTGPFRPFPRSVLNGELSLFPKPPWYPEARSAAATGRAMTEYAAAPSWPGLTKVLVHAFRA